MCVCFVLYFRNESTPNFLSLSFFFMAELLHFRPIFNSYILKFKCVSLIYFTFINSTVFLKFSRLISGVRDFGERRTSCGSPRTLSTCGLHLLVRYRCPFLFVYDQTKISSESQILLTLSLSLKKSLS